jgi:hypothetical protein
MTTIRLVIVILGAVLLTSVAGIIALSATNHPTPDVLQNIAVGSLTGLVGVLVPTRTNDQRE